MAFEKSVMVTGVGGFIGGPLVAHLAKNGWKVITVTTRDENDLAAAARLDLDGGIKYIKIPDINHYESYESAAKDVDVVVHLAGVAHQVSRRVGDDVYEAVNVRGAVKVAQAALRAGVKRFVYASSIKVHGDFTKNSPFTEQSPFDPRDAYAASKVKAERALCELLPGSGMELTIFRPTLVYGPGVKGNMANLLKLASKSPVVPYIQSANKRSFLYAGNLNEAVETLMTHPAAAGESFILSDGGGVSTRELILAISRGMGKNAILLPVPGIFLAAGAKFGDLWESLTGSVFPLNSKSVTKLTGSLLVDSSKITSLTGWRPRFSMEEGIREMVKRA
ncbi:MAG: SDR family NAD(P)-dependent oxidoreductase [Nitrospinae bacterium]|nr:SDR family NAD(P)-dependent oxidoreductase [Nitrospinota bacterium]